jgi:hypothetical protein
METNTSLPNDVLHSENHSKLSAEQIAKAVARHKRDHAGARPEGGAPVDKAASTKTKKATKG